MNLLLHAAISVFLLSSMVSGQSVCKLAKSDQTTRWGGNQWIVSKETAVYRSLKGTVKQWVDDSSMEDALVEVFDKPDYLLCDFLPNNPNGCKTLAPGNQRRLVACITGKNGKFNFAELRAGNYELRVSHGSAWNVVHIYVSLDPVKGSNRSLKVSMTVGD